MLRELHINIDCADPDAQADFWCAALGYRRHGSAGQYRSIVDPQRRLPKLIFQQVPEPKAGKARLHLDLHVDDLTAEVDRLAAIGANVVGAVREMEGERWQVMADPEGNEFCLCWHPDDTEG